MGLKRSNKPVLSLLVTGLILIMTAAYVHGATQYVSDNLIITVRSGMGEEFRILKTLKTGTPVEVLEESSKYYKVRTTDGTEGWALKQYITTDTPKTTIISGLRREIEKLRNNIGKLEGEREALKKDLKSEKGLRDSDVKELEKTLKEKNDRINGLSKELQEATGKYDRLVADSGDVIKIAKERDTLSKENARLDAENSELLKKNDRLLKKNMIYWFLAGGGVFLFGWIAGQISKKKKRTYYNY